MLANLTQPELAQLREDISAESLMIQKFGAYASACADPQLKQILSGIQNTHQRHRDILTRHLMGGLAMM